MGPDPKCDVDLLPSGPFRHRSEPRFALSGVGFGYPEKAAPFDSATAGQRTHGIS